MAIRGAFQIDMRLTELSRKALIGESTPKDTVEHQHLLRDRAKGLISGLRELSFSQRQQANAYSRLQK